MGLAAFAARRISRLAGGAQSKLGKLITESTAAIAKLILWKEMARSRLSQRSLQDAPIFRLLLKVAVKGTHQCDFLNF